MLIIKHFSIFVFFNNNKFYDKYIEIIPKKYIEYLLTINKGKIEEKLNKKELFEITKKNLNNDNKLYYFVDFEIISEKIIKYFLKKDFINDYKNNVVECLIGYDKLIIYPSLSDKKIALIANLKYIDNKNEFNSELIIKFNDSIKLKNYIGIIKEKGYKDTISKLKFINKKANIINDSNGLDGTAYEINKEKTVIYEIANKQYLNIKNDDIKNEKINELQEELNNFKIKYAKLEKELKEEKNKNINLEEEKNNFKEIINNLKVELDNEIKKNNNNIKLDNEIKYNKIQNDLYKTIFEKDKEIKE